MGLIKRIFEGIAIGLGIVFGFYLFAKFGFGIGDFVIEIASKIGGLFNDVGSSCPVGDSC